jgi:hypothetical protein
VVSFTSRPLYPQGRSPCYPLNMRLGGHQSRSGRGGEEKNSQPLPVLEPLIIQLVAHRYTTEISRLLVEIYEFILNSVHLTSGSKLHTLIPYSVLGLSLLLIVSATQFMTMHWGIKRPGREADYSPPSSAEAKDAWSYKSTPPIRLHGVGLS